MRTTGLPKTEDGSPYPRQHMHTIPPGTTTSVSEGASGYHVHVVEGPNILVTDGHWHDVAV